MSVCVSLRWSVPLGAFFLGLSFDLRSDDQFEASHWSPPPAPKNFFQHPQFFFDLFQKRNKWPKKNVEPPSSIFLTANNLDLPTKKCLNPSQKKFRQFFFLILIFSPFQAHPPKNCSAPLKNIYIWKNFMAMVILSKSVKRFSVSRMRDFYSLIWLSSNFLHALIQLVSCFISDIFTVTIS